MMLEVKEPKEQLREQKLKETRKERQEYQKEGIGTAVEIGDPVWRYVTVGDESCDYLDWKHFFLGQIARIGLKRFADVYSWDTDELIEKLAEENQDSNLWFDEAQTYFDAMQSD